MLYQLSKTRNPKVNKRDIVKSVDGFANVLLATGRKTQVGSPTAQRLEFQQKGGQNILSRILEFPPGIKIIQRYFDEQTFSKTSEKLSNAMTSEKGIDALINLSENWKDPNAAIGYLRALIISSERLN